MPRIILFFCLILTAAFNTASAETVYVTDKLHLSLHEQPNGSGKLLKTLTSGQQLTLLERTRYFARVETEEGLIGWTKAGFLVDEMPPSLRTFQLQELSESLSQKLETAKQTLDLSQQRVSELEQQLAATGSEASQRKQAIDELQTRHASLQSELKHYRGSVPLVWLLSAAGLALALGFAAGLWCLDAIIRRRHGGFRIY